MRKSDGLDMAESYVESLGDGLELTDGSLSLRVDFTDMLPRLRQDRLSHELLVRAAKVKNLNSRPIAIDATAGLGEDSLLLAAAGFYVHMYEKDARVFALLEDAMSRALNYPELAVYVERMELEKVDSRDALATLAFTPEIIYLDPMFPARKKSAAVKKKFQLLHQLALNDEDAIGLLNTAIAVRPRKIIIKRPLKGPLLGDIKPSYSIVGKAIRYDCIVFA